MILDYPWERGLLLIGVLYGIYTIAWRNTFCQTKVDTDLADVQFLVESCTLDKRFQTAYDCISYAKKLEPEYANEAWWQCFWNSFYFYRSWMRIIGLPVLVVFTLKIWNFLSKKDKRDRVRYVDHASTALTIPYFEPYRENRHDRYRRPRLKRSRRSDSDSSDD